MYTAIIADIVTIVDIWGGVDRAEPYYTDAQVLEIVQSGNDAGYVADPVAVGVLKAAGIYLIYCAFLPPFCHRAPSFARMMKRSSQITCMA
jgi:hypothetical protein